MTDANYADQIEAFIEQGAERGEPAESVPAPAEPDEQEPDYDDTADGLAQLYARANAMEQEARQANDVKLEGAIARIKDVGQCCDDATHFDEQAVLRLALELGPPFDLDKAWKVWHGRTFGWKAKGDPAERGAVEAAVEEIANIAELKRKHTVKREPHKGRMYDDPRLDTILDRALGPVRGNAISHD